MTSRTIRVTVRGSFDGLSATQTAQLVAEQAEHDFLNTVYTPEGYLAYDLPGRPFWTFRFIGEVTDEADIPQLAVRSEDRALAWMTDRGYPVRNVSSQTVDMSQVPLGKRGRREADRTA